MSDEDALLRAILDRPDDDLPRLVLADWLDEHGEAARAEFIRIQCELARLSVSPCGGYYCDEAIGHIDCEDPTGEKRAAASKRSRELLEQPSHGTHGAANWCVWSKPASDLIPSNSGSLFGQPFEFRRGFVESVACDLRTFAGGPCENCAGFGEFLRRHDNSDGPEGPCPDCGGKWNSGPHDDTDSYWDRGTGRTPGVAPDLFARQPVTKVTLVEKKPVYSEGSKGCDARWSRQTREGDDSPWVLPPYLFDQLPHRLARYVRDNYHEYESLADSREALSAAAVAWGRSVARG